MTPIGELDPQFSSPDARPTPWDAARDQLEGARTYWLATVRPDGRPHVTTIAGVWVDDALHFVTGASERKARNLAAGNPHVVVTTGCNGWDGLDVVVEGEAVRVTDADRLGRVGEASTRKYDDFFMLRFEDGRLRHLGTDDELLAFEIHPTKAFGFGKGDSFSQTRWRFPAQARTGG